MQTYTTNLLSSSSFCKANITMLEWNREKEKFFCHFKFETMLRFLNVESDGQRDKRRWRQRRLVLIHDTVLQRESFLPKGPAISLVSVLYLLRIK